MIVSLQLPFAYQNTKNEVLHIVFTNLSNTEMRASVCKNS